MSPHHLRSLALLHHALLALARSLTPLIFGITLVGLLLAVLQGAFQFEDAALAMAAKLAVILLLAGTSGEMIFLIIEHLAKDWLLHIPAWINRDWS